MELLGGVSFPRHSARALKFAALGAWSERSVRCALVRVISHGTVVALCETGVGSPRSAANLAVLVHSRQQERRRAAVATAGG